MPNWCSNNITIQGPAELIKSIWAAAQTEGSGLLNAMLPMPKELLEGDGWYDWAVSNWGTKWDISNEGLQYEELPDGRAMIHGWFDSAWSPPIGAVAKFCDANEAVYVCMSYFEPGMSFIGIWDNENIGDVCYDDVSGLIVGKAADEDIQLAELFDEFGVESWYDFDEEEIEDEA
jgi:hypothetical protein